MGDVRTHAEIYRTFIQPNLPEDVPKVLVEFGNYLTDVSQFRDPWAHVGGKSTVWSEEFNWFLRYTLLADFFGGDNYLDLLLGGREADDGTGIVLHGKLAEWLREVIYVFSLERRFRGPDGAYLIDPDEFKRLYDVHFTQYYPHEHLDYQPTVDGKLNVYSQSAATVPGGTDARRIIDYLDADIEYVGDLLTQVERHWARGGSVDDERLHDLLVQYGHACHAVEDFFFHSNFVEFAHAEASPGSEVAHFDPAETIDDTDPDGDRVPGPESVRWDRIYFRRVRQPIHGDDGEADFSDTESDDTGMLYTASIPMPDIFHTFIDAIGHLSREPAFDVMPTVEGVLEACESSERSRLLASLAGLTPAQRRGFPHALMGKMMPAEGETEDDEEDREKAYEAYRCLVEHDVLKLAFELAERRGEVHQSSVDAIEKASRIERELWSFLPGFLSGETGAAKFMIKLVEKARKEVSEAAEKTEELDRQNQEDVADDVAVTERKGYVPSDNGTSAERIGTHSLMSKDSIRKQPLRRQALTGAGFTVSYLTKTMVDQMSDATRVPEGVDWYELLRHFLTHPAQAAPSSGTEWWRAALEWDRSPPGRPDEAHDVKDVPASTLGARIAEAQRTRLEPLYNDLASVGEERFRDTINAEWRAGSAVWGGLLGFGFGWGGAGCDTAEEAVAGMFAGAASGALVSFLLSTIGTAVDDRAGSVVGLLTGVTAASFTGFGVGRLMKEVV